MNWRGLKFAASATLAGAAVAASPASPPVPAGWKVDVSARGDLTGDGIADVAMVIRRANPRGIVQNDGLGTQQLDTNPRQLVVFAGNGRGFRQIAASKLLIPPAGSTDSPCLEDPLTEGGLAIARGVLSVRLHYWLSCGSYGVRTDNFKFRREGARFRLIGFDRLEFMRSSGEGEELSYNLLTGERGVRPFAIDNDKSPRWRSSRFAPPVYYLDGLDPAACPWLDTKVSLC